MLLAAALAGAVAFAPAPPERPPEKIVVTSASEDGTKVGLFIMNADGSKRTPLSKDGAKEVDGALSADGKHIVFVALGADGASSDLWTMDADGSNRKQFTQNPAKTVVMAPSWSPDGKRILFTRMAADALRGPMGDMDIVVVGADGKDEKSIAKGLMASWSPDGKQVLYTAMEKMGGFEPRVWVMDADGKNSKMLVNMPSMMAAFSPDGKRIAFVGAPSTAGTQPRVYTANADGSNAVQVSKPADGFEIGPRWSADGKRIYFSRMPAPKNGPPGSKSSILVMDADGNNEKQLTPGDTADMLGGAALFLMERMQARPVPPPE